MINTKKNDVDASGVARRRRWTAYAKLVMVCETYEPAMSVSLVARKHGINPNQLYYNQSLLWSRMTERSEFIEKIIARFTANDSVSCVMEYRLLQAASDDALEHCYEQPHERIEIV